MSTAPKQICILRRKQLQVRLGLARSTLYAKLNPNSASYDPTFPRPFKLGAGARLVGWLESDVEAWILQCANPTSVTNDEDLVGGAA
ncbi:helix-turn-helix transcriptional regulator [Chitinibacter sp. S2-10]|uniref:helix-turn-helix transcriptional regulator n=1 Tax=Chitinibacter sp. S2-10 TaxID=3373597 RepID=UPI00397737C2